MSSTTRSTCTSRSRTSAVPAQGRCSLSASSTSSPQGEMTGGEIDRRHRHDRLGGEVGPIGGIQQKLVGARGERRRLLPGARRQLQRGRGARARPACGWSRSRPSTEARDAVETIGSGARRDAAHLRRRRRSACGTAAQTQRHRSGSERGAQRGDQPGHGVRRPPTASSESCARLRTAHDDSPPRSTPTASRTSCRSGWPAAPRRFIVSADSARPRAARRTARPRPPPRPRRRARPAGRAPPRGRPARAAPPARPT